VTSRLRRGGFGGGCFRYRNLHGIGLRPSFLSIGQLQAVHGNPRLPVVHFHEKMVVVDSLLWKGRPERSASICQAETLSMTIDVGFRRLASGKIAASRDGGTGRRSGLKIRRASRPWGFDSPSRHQPLKPTEYAASWC
jgi:hypothetical protein